jgi:hypothetical protein
MERRRRGWMNEHLKELVMLSEENPELEVLFMVDQEVGVIVRVRTEVYSQVGNGMVFGEDGIKEMLEEELFVEHRDINDEYVKLLASGEIIKKAIIVYIGARPIWRQELLGGGIK